MNINKVSYFQQLLNKAVQSKMPEKADYYRRRLKEIDNEPSSQRNSMINLTPSTKLEGEMLQGSIKVWNIKNHSAATRHAFLANKGIPEYIIFQALEYVGHGKKISDI